MVSAATPDRTVQTIRPVVPQPLFPGLAGLTLGPSGLPESGTRALLRYSGACLVILGLHAALFAYVSQLHPVPIGDSNDSPPAVMIDLPPAAPTPSAPPPDDMTRPQLPPQPEVQPLQETQKLPEIPPSPAPSPEAVLPPPPKAPPVPQHPKLKPVQPPKPKPVQKPAEHVEENPRDAPPAPAAPPSPDAAQAASAARQAQASWYGRVAGHLLRFKRYPRMAELRHEEGVVKVRFSVDEAGHVTGFTILTSSGHELLDEGAREWIDRAQPLPPPPQEISHGRPMVLSVPLSFTIADR
ncbi:energy transducer TonB [Granulibacter bethesdensis]|uniref:Protein TonB n=1 Tax=Granulibacter bethesdensis (strain ATCC BAA-1260 / CGDNIH1) TaxID=391165 RepID=Q0BW63_GRABC|nr:energy transducer TonB [Granulibacter bethesdensis]ABI60939.1 TonB protein [Granulibacter bethesdensis CGDNIH1]AHJ67023.1 TonB protein [Granulibacter bethesdensis]APH50704.1 TonB protein [Granulibacter bethesdensis]APH63399.1 TonB protein [Granulibacter bethesdensis]